MKQLAPKEHTIIFYSWEKEICNIEVVIPLTGKHPHGKPDLIKVKKAVSLKSQEKGYCLDISPEVGTY